MPTLYHCKGSRGFRALWALEEAGADYQLVVMPFPPRSKAKSFKTINPLGTVPAFADGEIVMTESSAIAFYVTEKFGKHDLLVSSNEADYGPFIDYLHHADATLTFPQTVYLRFAMLERDLGLAKAGEAYATWFGGRLDKVKLRLADRAYLCADRFTVADIVVHYALHLAAKIGLSHFLDDVLNAYLERLEERPAFQSALRRESESEETSTPQRDC